MSWINILRNWKVIRINTLRNLLGLFKIIKIKKNKIKFYHKKLKNLRMHWVKKLKRSKLNMRWKFHNLNKNWLNNNKTFPNNNPLLWVFNLHNNWWLWNQDLKRWKINWNSVKVSCNKLTKVKLKWDKKLKS